MNLQVESIILRCSCTHKHIVPQRYWWENKDYPENVQIPISSKETSNSYTGQYLLVQIENTHVRDLDIIHKNSSYLFELIQVFKNEFVQIFTGS